MRGVLGDIDIDGRIILKCNLRVNRTLDVGSIPLAIDRVQWFPLGNMTINR
jgi:hypothetical protein